MPFTEEQALFFFGRDRERDIIIANLMAARVDAVLRSERRRQEFGAQCRRRLRTPAPGRRKTAARWARLISPSSLP